MEIKQPLNVVEVSLVFTVSYTMALSSSELSRRCFSLEFLRLVHLKYPCFSTSGGGLGYYIGGCRPLRLYSLLICHKVGWIILGRGDDEGSGGGGVRRSGRRGG